MCVSSSCSYEIEVPPAKARGCLECASVCLVAMKLKNHRLKPVVSEVFSPVDSPCAQVFTVPTERLPEKWSFYWCFERQRRWHGGCRRLVQSAKGDEPPYTQSSPPRLPLEVIFPATLWHPLLRIFHQKSELLGLNACARCYNFGASPAVSLATRLHRWLLWSLEAQ